MVVVVDVVVVVVEDVVAGFAGTRFVRNVRPLKLPTGLAADAGAAGCFSSAAVAKNDSPRVFKLGRGLTARVVINDLCVAACGASVFSACTNVTAPSMSAIRRTPGARAGDPKRR